MRGRASAFDDSNLTHAEVSRRLAISASRHAFRLFRIAALPKAELHMHLEGSLEPETLMQLAQRISMRLPYAEALGRAYQFENLQSFLDLYYLGLTVLQTGADFHEMTGPYIARAASQSVRHAEVFISPHDHGVRCEADPDLVDRLADRGTPLTVCPCSNIMLRVFPALTPHNTRRLHEAGLCVSVNSDDPSYFSGYINENFAAIQAALGFPDDELWQLARNGFTSAFLSDD